MSPPGRGRYTASALTGGSVDPSCLSAQYRGRRFYVDHEAEAIAARSTSCRTYSMAYPPAQVVHHG